HKDSHLAVEDIVALLAAQDAPVGRTTVYRCLDRLIEQGVVRKYSAGERACACFQLAGEDCCRHYHLKCTGCGALLHIECEQLDRLEAHILESHGFVLDPAKTVLYGQCSACAQTKKENAPCDCCKKH
ncbi:MAG: transcriptional repressor, partial [Oscillospiraceae bacterium]